MKNKYYHLNGEVIFNPLHSAHWTMFLYFMGYEISKYGEIDLCDKIYGISKIISSADIFYEVQMPDIWFFDHPQGSVMGRAKYGNFFTFSQGCTVGGNKDMYPNIGEHVSMMSCSQILGKCDVGDHVILAANSCIIDESVPSYSIVFGATPNIIIHNISDKKFDMLTNSMFDSSDSMEKN